MVLIVLLSPPAARLTASPATLVCEQHRWTTNKNIKQETIVGFEVNRILAIAYWGKASYENCQLRQQEFSRVIFCYTYIWFILNKHSLKPQIQVARRHSQNQDYTAYSAQLAMPAAPPQSLVAGSGQCLLLQSSSQWGREYHRLHRNSVFPCKDGEEQCPHSYYLASHSFPQQRKQPVLLHCIWSSWLEFCPDPGQRHPH